MISYRKLAMRVLGHSPVSAPKTARRRSTAKRAAALALTAALVVGMTLPAFADTWFIEDGNISISAGTNGNNVTQNGTTTENDTNTVIKGNGSSNASSNTVTIDAGEGKTVDVTLDNVNINTSETGGAAVSVTGKGDTNIELDGNNTLTSGYYHAGLEHNKTDDSGTLTITDNNNDGKLTANGGYKGAGIGGGYSSNGTVTITGGDINANGGYKGAGIGGGSSGLGNVSIEGNVTIKNAQGGVGAAGIGGGARGTSDAAGNGNKISIKSTAAGSPNITAKGGKASDDGLSGGAAIGSGSVVAGATEVKSDITIEGKVTINATGGGNVAIGDNIDGEKVFNGLAGGTNIKRTDSNGKDVTQDGDVVAEPEPEPKPEPEEPEKPAQPTVTPTEAAEAPSTGSVEVEHPVTVEGLYVTNVLGKQITHTCTQNGTTLTIRANGIVTSAHLTLGMVRTLKAQGVETLVLTTLLSRSTTVSVDALLAAEPDAPDETAVVWTHTGPRATLTINGTDHSALLK